jgi:hypothetical protein
MVASKKAVNNMGEIALSYHDDVFFGKVDKKVMKL